MIGGYACHNAELNCKNGGVCKKSEGGSPYCDCPVAYEGDSCQFLRGKSTRTIIYRGYRELCVAFNLK